MNPSRNVKVELGPVQETLLIPLLGRAEQTTKKRGMIHDPKAVEIVSQLDYDFDKWKGIPSLLGASIRTRIFDEEVKAFLQEHPDGTVVEIGAGLNTRYERLDNGKARWFELDLPDSMVLRRRFFEDTDRRTMLDASALETDWYDTVAAPGGSLCFVSEAVLIYLDAPDLEGMFRRQAACFPGAWFITDTICGAMVDNQHKHDAMSKMPQNSWFRWKCDDPATLSEWGLKLQESMSFLDAPSDVVADMPTLFRLVTRYAPWLLRRKIDGYRINRFVLTP